MKGIVSRSPRTFQRKVRGTEDEPWVLFKNIKRKEVCVSPEVSPKGKPKDVQCKKANVVYLVRQKRNRSLGDHFKRRYWCNGEDERQQ